VHLSFANDPRHYRGNCVVSGLLAAVKKPWCAAVGCCARASDNGVTPVRDGRSDGVRQ
jgi:hypothetical protein